MKISLSLLALFSPILGIIAHSTLENFGQESKNTYTITGTAATDFHGPLITEVSDTSSSETPDDLEPDEARPKLLIEHQLKLIELRVNYTTSFLDEMEDFEKEAAFLKSIPSDILDQQVYLDFRRKAKRVQKKISSLADFQICFPIERQHDPARCNYQPSMRAGLRSTAARMQEILDKRFFFISEELNDNIPTMKPLTTAQLEQIDTIIQEGTNIDKHWDVISFKSSPCTSSSSSQCKTFVLGATLRVKRLSELVTYAKIDLGCPDGFPMICDGMFYVQKYCSSLIEDSGLDIDELLPMD